MDTDRLLQQRRAKDEFFRTDHHSPIPHPARVSFDGLDYYPPNPDLVFTLDMEPADGSEIVVATSDGQERRYRRAGTVSFEVDGEPATLTLYDTGHHGFFVPFRDATSGSETYGAGRYLDLDHAHDGAVTIDFNEAYNPFCAYDEAYSCPLPPVENWLKVPIRAGERDYSSD